MRGIEYLRGRHLAYCRHRSSEARAYIALRSIDKSSTEQSSAPRDSKTPAISALPFAPSHSRSPAISVQNAEVAALKSDSKSVAYENRTKSAKCGGLETNGRRERISGPDGCVSVRRFTREARGYWASMRARRPAENVGLRRTGGGRGTGIQHSLNLWSGIAPGIGAGRQTNVGEIRLAA